MENGYFDDIRKEYVITNRFPRREWLNYLWNCDTVAVFSQFGDGNSWSLIGHERRSIEVGERLVYVREKEGNAYLINSRSPKASYDAWECHVGLGYQTIHWELHGLAVDVTFLVPSEGKAIEEEIQVSNRSSSQLEGEVIPLLRPSVALAGHDYGKAEKASSFCGLLYSYLGYHISSPDPYLFLATDEPFTSFEVSGERFRGHYGTYEDPAALRDDKPLSSAPLSSGSDFIGALVFPYALKPGETKTVHLTLGVANDEREASALANEFTKPGTFAKEMALQKEKNEAYTGVFHLESPDKTLNSQVNLWLKRQLSLGKDWGRVYGKGFRDVTQDLTAFVSLDTACARQRLLTILSHQYEDGNPIRMYEPDFYYPYNDGAVWIPAAVLTYLNESGDLSVMDEKIPYLPGKSKEHWNLADAFCYTDYQGTSYRETVYQHLKKAMDYLYSSRGERGLVLFLGGDWNDSMNAVGLKGKGESVWLTIAAVKAYREFLTILDILGKTEEKPLYEARLKTWQDAILSYGYDQDHWIYGYDDEGRKIGAYESEGPQIFLNPQTWAVMAHLTDEKTLAYCMDTAEKELICDYGYRQCYPSYTKGDDHIGRISYLQPGMVENGAVYCHGVAFKIVADCMLGRHEEAYRSLKMIRFDNPKNLNNGMEPYAISNMYIGPDNPMAGYAPMSWITGTAGWFYRAVTEFICGIQATFHGLRVTPCLPDDWDQVTCSRLFRGTMYHITLMKDNASYGEEDGNIFSGNLIPVDERKERYIRFHVASKKD